jgi:hypothetical protein
LQLKLRRQIGDLVLSRFAVRDRLVQRRPQVTIVDSRKDLTGLHRLVVIDQHLGDVAGDAGCDDDRVSPDVGVVGFDLKPPNLPVMLAVGGGSRKAERTCHAKQCLLQGQAATSNPGSARINAGRALDQPTHGSLLVVAVSLPFRRNR